MRESVREVAGGDEQRVAAELLGARLKDCIAIEDAQAGIDAIKAAGIFAVGIGPGLIGSDLLFDDTASVDWAAIEAAFASTRG